MTPQPPNTHSAATVRLHIGVAAAETGVSRFGERLSPAIEYAKTEHLPLSTRVREYDYLIVEAKEAEIVAGQCEEVALVDGTPVVRLRDWLAAAREGPQGLKALMAQIREQPWEEWFVSTRPVLVVLRCGHNGGGQDEEDLLNE